MTDDDEEDESDKHPEARDRRYSCLTFKLIFEGNPLEAVRNQ